MSEVSHSEAAAQLEKDLKDLPLPLAQEAGSTAVQGAQESSQPPTGEYSPARNDI